MDDRENMQRCQEYISALEEERYKISVFQRELPLCFELVTQAVEACKRQFSGTTTECLNRQSDCSERTASDGPILEEFIPIRRSSSTDDDDELESLNPEVTENQRSDKSGKKSDWLRSVQLWNQTIDPPSKEDTQPRKVSVLEVKKNGGAFHPFRKENSDGNKPTSAAAAVPAASACSTAEITAAEGGGSGGSKKDEKEGKSQRKARRCWSPELHRRFLNAVQQLGGSHVATPKQIRELMKADGLSNDEVKSHLQKYRLHTSRPTPSRQHNADSQAPQFIDVRGIWVPLPQHYAATAAAGAILREAATVALAADIHAEWPQPNQANQLNCEKRVSRCDDGVHSNSQPLSSSTHTSAASPAF